MRNLIFILSAAVLVLMNSCCNAGDGNGGFVESEEPVELTQEQADAWNAVADGLHGAWADADLLYGRSVVPEGLDFGAKRLVAWRGERVSAQIVLWSRNAVSGVKCKVKKLESDEEVLPSSAVNTYFVRYTLADQMTPKFMETSRLKKGTVPEVLVPDMLDTLSCLDMEECSARPVWLTVDVPQDAVPGVYKAEVVVRHDGFGKVVLPLELEVVSHVLPDSDDWSYYLDLWQHPTSVARAHGLEVWSDEHFEAMRPVMQRLADAGQKVVTATLNKDPWNHQCYDGYEAMITWTKCKDGSWKYDYKVFDRWVEMMLDLGIDKAINCYSMVPWNCELEYFDEAEGSLVTVKAEPGTPIFPEIWRPFLMDFKKHLDEKGWLAFTNIAMDERAPEAMEAAADVLEECAPEMGFALADNHKSYKKFTMMRDVCVSMRHSVVDREDIVMRRENGQTTTFYVCCNPSFPNTFTGSQPYESEMLGWYNLAYDYDGMLRWAYNSWAEDPQYDSRFGNWMSGDTYLVYPYNRSSIRFERLRDGIEIAEKVRKLRREGVEMPEVEKCLEEIRSMNANDYTLDWRRMISRARAALDEVSKR